VFGAERLTPSSAFGRTSSNSAQSQKQSSQAAASVPNAVTDEMYAELESHWSDEETRLIVAEAAISSVSSLTSPEVVLPSSEPHLLDLSRQASVENPQLA